MPEFIAEMIKRDKRKGGASALFNALRLSGPPSYQQIFAASVITSTIDMSDKVYDSKTMALLTNRYSMEYYQRSQGAQSVLDKGRGRSAKSNVPGSGGSQTPAGKENWEYPYYYTVYLAHNFKTGMLAGNETCAAVTEQEALAEMSKQHHAVDSVQREAALSIFNKGFGCFSCPASKPGHATYSYAYFTLQNGNMLSSET